MSEDPKPIDLYKEIIEMRELIEANREMLSKSPPFPALKTLDEIELKSGRDC
jgi:hypothetical protein